MQLGAGVRSVVTGGVAAVVVVGSYAWGHVGRASAQAPAVVAATVPQASPTATPSSSGISVDGTGKVTGTPNLLRLDSSVNVTKPAVTDAMQAANTTMAAVQQTLSSDGVAAADMQTSGLSVQPMYNYANNSQHLTGYQVSENLSVVLRNLSTAGAVIADAARVGGDDLQIGGATLDIDQDSALISQARQAAFADAEAKARVYAAAAGRTLGAVTSITESTDSQPQQFDYAYPAAAASEAAPAVPVPIQAGSQDVTVDVAVTWALN